MSVDRRFFEALMASKRLSLRALAGKMGMSHSQLSLTFSGARRMQLDEAAQLSGLLGVSLQQIAYHAGVGEAIRTGRRVKLAGTMRGDGTVHDAGAGRALAPEGLPDDAEAIQARTAETALGWMDGWVMFFEPCLDVHPASIGRLCVAAIKQGPLIIGTLRRGYDDGTVSVSGPFQGESLRMDWAAPILSIRP